MSASSFFSASRAAILPAEIASSYFYSAFSFSITLASIVLSPSVINIFEITEFSSFGNLNVTSTDFPSSNLSLSTAASPSALASSFFSSSTFGFS